VLSFALIKLFYSHRYPLYDRYIFVLSIFLFIIIPVIRADSRAISFRSVGTSRSINLSHSKPSFIALDKRPAGAISDAGGNSESSKYFCKLANLFDRIYIALFYRFFLLALRSSLYCDSR
jgi:hypothetical protein